MIKNPLSQIYGYTASIRRDMQGEQISDAQ